MKLNWGIGAFTLFGAFVVFIIIMVFLASNQTHELVTEDYYEKELEFKEVLKKKEKTDALEGKFSTSVTNDSLVIAFPVENSSNLEGIIYFFKPSSEKDDKEIPFTISSNTLSVDVNDFTSGMYRMKIDWKYQEEEYYYEQKIDIPLR